MGHESLSLRTGDAFPTTRVRLGVGLDIDSRALDLAPNSSTEIATGILRPREYQG